MSIGIITIPITVSQGSSRSYLDSLTLSDPGSISKIKEHYSACYIFDNCFTSVGSKYVWQKQNLDIEDVHYDRTYFTNNICQIFNINRAL